MIRQIITAPNPVLFKSAEKAIPDRQLRKDLIDTLAPLEYAVGLAAPQIGVSKNIFALKNPDSGKITVYRNPKITYASLTREEDIEGCLSLPKEYYKVKRSTEIKLKHDKGEETFSGDLARVVQHEIDHLRGILISDIGEKIVPFEKKTS